MPTERIEVANITLVFKCEDADCDTPDLYNSTPRDVVNDGTPICPHCDSEMELQEHCTLTY